ncbi:hypothetical protein ABZZ80_16870, partial [Streptomyces sp. NPDC006356]
AAALRRREVLARIAAEPIDVPQLAPARLASLAVEHRNRQEEKRALGRWQRGRGHVAKPTTVENAEPAELDRWKVEYLRHRLTRHHEILGALYGSTGRAAAEELLWRRVYLAISEAYPNLAQEYESRPREQQRGPSPG